MRIGLLTTSFPRWEGDVAGAFVLGFARALVDRGHHLRVLAPEPAEALPIPTWDGVDLSWIRYVEPRSWARTFYGAGVPDNLRRDPGRGWAWLPFRSRCGGGPARSSTTATRWSVTGRCLRRWWRATCAPIVRTWR